MDVIINAAAYTAVDDAETDEHTARLVNEAAPRIIAAYCKKRAIPLVHISTDYVFSGHKRTPYGPKDITNPKSVYGHSKQLGEIHIQASGCHHLILRTSWLYDVTHKNFLTAMLNLAGARDAVSVVNDQFGRPTFADELARVVLLAAGKLQQSPNDYSGVYHVSDKGQVVSWAEFAMEIFKTARPHFVHEMTVKPISTADYGARAPRPAYSALDTSAFETTFNIQLQDWQLNLKTAIRDWHRKNSEK